MHCTPYPWSSQDAFDRRRPDRGLVGWRAWLEGSPWFVLSRCPEGLNTVPTLVMGRRALWIQTPRGRYHLQSEVKWSRWYTPEPFYTAPLLTSPQPPFDKVWSPTRFSLPKRACAIRACVIAASQSELPEPLTERPHPYNQLRAHAHSFSSPAFASNNKKE